LNVLDKNKASTHECGCGCSECGCGRRNRFFRGKRMKAHDFEIEQLYGIERRRILNRSVVGSGVVTGFAMEKESSVVGPGFALDAHGREIVLADKARLGPENLFLMLIGASGCRTVSLDEARPRTHYLLSVHYAERMFGDAALPGGCGCDKPEKNYICETAVFSLLELRGPCPCGEEPCDRTCDCSVTDACAQPRPPDRHDDRPDRTKGKYAEGSGTERGKLEAQPADAQELPPPERDDAAAKAFERDRIDTHVNRGRGPHACVCHELMASEIDCSAPAMCDWNGYRIDPSDGVALACVIVDKTDDGCHPIQIDVVDACGPRHFVKNNELLYDFIRGCDLTRISWVSWHFWHRHTQPMPWKVFASAFDAAAGGENPPPVKTKFVIRFSGPVLADTIRFDSIAIRAVTVDQSTAWRLIRRVPITKLDLTPYGSTALPAGTTNQIQVHVDAYWVRDEIAGGSSWLTWDVFEIDIEVNGDGILDCHRLPIDGEAIGLEAFPSGNGSPGGIYRSSFRVEPKPHSRQIA
jgi:hypothetical protein